ncbi:uncharacterized protein [Eurosta solidaginis]|uniref:uncharacterized protein n=1 Tax=Eurosta solidaginis TaxID=178769 RepID=UPI0035317C32
MVQSRRNIKRKFPMKENIVQVNRQEEHYLEENARDVNCVEDSLSQQDSIDHQSSMVMGTLAEHTLLMEKPLFQERKISALGEVFPIKDDCQLNELNENNNGQSTLMYFSLSFKIC